MTVSARAAVAARSMVTAVTRSRVMFHPLGRRCLDSMRRGGGMLAHSAVACRERGGRGGRVNEFCALAFPGGDRVAFGPRRGRPDGPRGGLRRPALRAPYCC